MKNERLNILRPLLLVSMLSIFVMIPMQLNAQIAGKTHGDKLGTDANDDEKFCSEAGRRINNKFCDYYEEYKNSLGVDNLKAAEIRNRMIDLLKVQIDDYYNDHKNGRVTKTKWFQTVLDILGIGLAFTGNIVGGIREKTVLAATAGSFQAGRNSLNDRFHLLQHQILINKMNSNRLDQWARIVARKKDGINDFSWDNAKAELQQYLFRGSFTDALDSLVEQTGAQVQQSQVTLNNALTANTKASLSRGLVNFNQYIAPMNRTAIKLGADIDAQSLIIPAVLPDPLPTAVADAIAKKVALELQKANLMQNYKNIWAAIKASGDYDVIEGRLVTKYAAFPAVLNKFNLVKDNYGDPANTLTADDYDNALAKVNVVVKDDDDLNKRFLAILDLHKL